MPPWIAKQIRDVTRGQEPHLISEVSKAKGLATWTWNNMNCIFIWVWLIQMRFCICVYIQKYIQVVTIFSPEMVKSPVFMLLLCTHTSVVYSSCMYKITWCRMMWTCCFCCVRMNAAEPAVAVALKLRAGKWGAGNKELWGSRHVSPRTHTTQQIKGARGRVWWGNHTGFQSIVVLHLTSPPRPMIEILIRLPVS